MDGLAATIFVIVFTLIWIVFSVYCGVLMARLPYIKLKETHWTLKALWWYGFSFWALLVISVVSSFVVILAMILSKGI